MYVNSFIYLFVDYFMSMKILILKYLKIFFVHCNVHPFHESERVNCDRLVILLESDH